MIIAPGKTMDDWLGDIVAIASIDFLVLLPFAARQWARRPHYRRVPHRRLRVASTRGRSATGSTASRNAPVADAHTPTLRAAGQSNDHARIGGAAVSTSSETPHPAPSTPLDASLGAGLKQPVTVTPPDVAVAGSPPHPRGEVVADAVRPRLAASATQPLDAGAVAQTAPARITA